MDPSGWTPRDGTREWTRLVQAVPRDEIVRDPVKFALFNVGSSALLAFQRAVDQLSDRWLERSEPLMASEDPAVKAEGMDLRDMAHEMRSAVSGARLPHVPPGQRAGAVSLYEDMMSTRLPSEDADDD